jgi:iron complex outermembrane receptor protein
VSVRRVGALPFPEVPAYTTVDLRAGWLPATGIELSVAAQNIFDNDHAEFGNASTRSQFGRAIYAELGWSH